MNIRQAAFAVGIAAAAALVTQPALAHSIVLTELSPTTLTATYDGSTTGVTVTPGALPDTWDIIFSTVDFHVVVHPPIGFVPLGTWIEPENSALGNYVTLSPGGHLDIASDFSAAVTTFADESTVSNVGTDTRDNGPVSVTFDDDAARAEGHAVPDTGTSASLFGLSLAGLVFLRRKLC